VVDLIRPDSDANPVRTLHINGQAGFGKTWFAEAAVGEVVPDHIRIWRKLDTSVRETYLYAARNYAASRK